MHKHRRKMIAPILVTVILVRYYIGFFLVCALIEGIPLIGRVLAGILPLGLAGVSIAVLVERIREIRSGEEDDLSQY